MVKSLSMSRVTPIAVCVGSRYVLNLIALVVFDVVAVVVAAQVDIGQRRRVVVEKQRVQHLPAASWPSALGLGFLSAVFDNIPLTALALGAA